MYEFVHRNEWLLSARFVCALIHASNRSNRSRIDRLYISTVIFYRNLQSGTALALPRESSLGFEAFEVVLYRLLRGEVPIFASFIFRVSIVTMGSTSALSDSTVDSSDAQKDESRAVVAAQPIQRPQAAECKRSRKVRTVHLIIPYAIGIVWFLLHPIVSVVTGELKCRGSFIDESALEPGNLRVAPYPTDRTRLPRLNQAHGKLQGEQAQDGGGGLCAAISSASVLRSPFVSTRSRRIDGQETAGERTELISQGNIVCHTQHNFTSSSTNAKQGHVPSFDMVKIEPSSPAMSSEAVVLVVNPPPFDGDWSSSDMHLYYLALIGRLTDPNSTPWLSKTVLVVAPRIIGGLDSASGAIARDDILAETTEAFLESYLEFGEGGNRLPLSLSSKMVRQILVVETDAAPSSSSSSGINTPKLRILPQGRRGILPNLDFVFALGKAFGGGTILKEGGISMHQGNEAEWINTINKTFYNFLPRGQYFRQWLSDLLRMIAFSKDLILGPHPPHSVALDRGIDAVTIRLSLPSQHAAAGAELVQKLEQSLRALCNLHERLHHSVTQYLLPSDKKFVSNGEYIFPSVLVLLPLAARATSLALVDIKRFSIRTAALIGAICFGVAACTWVLILGLGQRAVIDFGLINAVVAGAYMLGLLGMNKVLGGCVENDRRSIQFVACLFAVYAHVPIALAHASLAIPSALLWTPLLAFLTLVGGKRTTIQRLLSAAVLFATWPPVSLVPRLFGDYTAYVLAVYIPLHLFFASMWVF